MKLTVRKLCKKYMSVLICILIISNLTQGTVLCFGTDGHVEFEPAFHRHFDDQVNYNALDQNEHSHEAIHEKGKHCKPCVDIPITIALAKKPHKPKQSDPTQPFPVANVVTDTYKINCSTFDLISNTSVYTSYFTPLRTVILVV